MTQSNSPPLVLLAGHCDPDSRSIEALLQRASPCRVEGVETCAEMLRRLESSRFDLVLLNRLFDATGEAALDWLPKIPAEQRRRCMLVSNFPEAHLAAVELGAMAGFGKRQLRAAETLALLSACLRVAGDPSPGSETNG